MYVQMPAPVVKPSSSHSGNKPKDGRPVDLVVPLKYNNTLPDIPFDPKFLAFPFPALRYVDYQQTTLEKDYKYDILTEPDLGIHVDLIDPDLYICEESEGPLDPVDERLLEDEAVATPSDKRSARHSKVVPWLRKTEYIAPEFTRYGQSGGERQETKVGYHIKKTFQDEILYKDKDSQIRAIEKTFADCEQKVDRHYSKANVRALEVLPIFPDFDLWKYSCAQVLFDSDPAPVNVGQQVQSEMMSQALIKGMMDEMGEQFVAYFLPTEDTLKQRQKDAEAGVEFDEDFEYQYKLAREYNWTVKNKASKGFDENFFLTFREDGVYYNELETRVRLNRRRTKDGIVRAANSRLLMKHRQLNDQELAIQENRLLQLQPPIEETEAEEAVEPAEETEAREKEGEDQNEPQGTPTANVSDDETESLQAKQRMKRKISSDDDEVKNEEKDELANLNSEDDAGENSDQEDSDSESRAAKKPKK